VSQISIRGLSFAYPGSAEKIFDNVSLTLDTSWKLGLIGRNGRGKTTLLKILAGELEYEGAISATVGFEYFPFRLPEQISDAAPLEAARLLGCEAESWEIESELRQIGLIEASLDTPYGLLSQGERMKCLLAALFLGQKGFLLIDEPTNHLDFASRGQVSRYLAFKSGFILVSHDRSFLNGAVDHILSINKSSVELQKGNFDSWQQNRTYKDGFELALNSKLHKEIGRLEIAYRRTAGWSDKVEKSRYGTGGDRGFIGHQSAKMMKRAVSVKKRQQKAIEEKAALLRDVEADQRLIMAPAAYHSERIAWAKGFGIVAGERVIAGPVDFEINRGMRLALLGPNGSGKSTLLGALLGQTQGAYGELYVAAGLKISYVPQSVEGLRGTLRGYAAEMGIDETLFYTSLNKLGFNRESYASELSELSEGEKKKALIASSLACSAQLYIWDEPLNYLDVYTRVAIENAILEFEPTMVFVEHDRAFAEAVATSLLELSEE